ncbi:unnamed protein product [Cochlearia groenlandica]
MNCILSRLFVIVLFIGLSNAGLWDKNTVHFINSFVQKENVLRVNCASDDDKFGLHFVNQGQTYNISFHDSIFKTRITCDLWQVSGLHAGFRAYEGGGGIIHYGKQNFWYARDDGVYFTHGEEEPKLEYRWA